MPVNFYKLLKVNDSLKDMPPVQISIRRTDKYIVYKSQLMRTDYIAGEVYSDETLWRLIMLANPEYIYEFDIPDNTIIRIPYPLNDVLAEVNNTIVNTRDR